LEIKEKHQLSSQTLSRKPYILQFRFILFILKHSIQLRSKQNLCAVMRKIMFVSFSAALYCSVAHTMLSLLSQTRNKNIFKGVKESGSSFRIDTKSGWRPLLKVSVSSLECLLQNLDHQKL